ncbi:MAG: membrane protein insertase YidC [Bacteroidales bacterium]|nr:membrane protein insertase YidC [Bacteroidales bacterium]
MSFFDYLLAPFTFIIREIFLLGYELTGSYGLSIIILSFIISLGLLPIFMLIEKGKKRNDEIKQRMKIVADEIKRCYKGQERFYYLKTLNRQHGYSPLKALIPILSLLLQIPFFIAAYQFLINYEPLSGIDFLFINDLGAPDGLLGSVNILPILMTLVNVITAYLYTINGDKKERNQMFAIAGVFLVLLFNLPSGLVLYWTMNNVFSFFRLFITNPEVFGISTKRIGNLFQGVGPNNFLQRVRLQFGKAILVIIAVFVVLTALQVHWAFKHSFDSIYLRIGFSFLISLFLGITIAVVMSLAKKAISLNAFIRSINPKVYLTMLFLAFYFYFAARFYFSGVNNNLLKLSLVLLVFIGIINIASLIQFREQFNRWLLCFLFFCIAVLASMQLLTFFAIVKDSVLTLSLLNLNIEIQDTSWLNFVSLGLVIVLLSSPFYLKENFKPKFYLPKGGWLLLLLSGLYVSGTIFFWNPMIVYSSYPANFDFPAISFLVYNFLPFIGLLGIVLMVYIFLPIRVKPLAIKSLLIVAIVVFLYSSIIPNNVGVLNVNQFSNDENLAKGYWYYLVEACLLVCIYFFTTWLYNKVKTKRIMLGLVLLNVLIIGQSTNLAYKTGALFSKGIAKGEDEGGAEIVFSKTEKNLVLFIIDAAQGWYMHDFINEDPSLKDDYSGFTYYPNTMSMANYTYASVPSMMCGDKYSIANMNMDESRTIAQKVSDATEEFYGRIKEQGYDLTSTIMRYSTIDHSKFDTYLPRWHDAWTRKLKLEDPEEMWYTRLWENAVFSSVPLFLKPRVYNKTKWIMKEKTFLNLTEFNEYNFVRALPLISNTGSKKPNFIYIHSLYTHDPWNMIDQDNNFIRDVTPYESQLAFTHSFVKWIQWMKENGVYDNTKIILVSDHGPSWWHYKGEYTSNAPIVWTEDNKISLERFLHLNPLLMVKDYHSNLPLEMDWRLMMNADVSAIAFDQNDPTKTDSVSRIIQIFYTTWHQDLNTRTKYEIKHAFEIKDWAYDLNNWTSIKEE